MAGPLWPVPAIWLGDQRENRLTNAQSEAFNPAVGDATSFPGASTRLAGSCARDRCHCAGAGSYPEWSNMTRGKGGCCLSGIPHCHSITSWTTLSPASSSWAGLWQRSPVAAQPHCGLCRCSHLPASHLLDLFSWLKGLFLLGFMGQFPIFASTCPGKVSWQVGSSWAGDPAASHRMLQPLFWAESLQCTAETQRCCWMGSQHLVAWASSCIEESCSHQQGANPKPLLTQGKPGCSALPGTEVSVGICHLP